MLQPLVWMRYLRRERYFLQKECFVFFYFPDAEPGMQVNILLIKYRQN